MTIATQKPTRIVGLHRTIGREVSGGPRVVGRSESQLARKLCRRKVQKRWHPGAASYSGISYRVGGTGKQECLRYVYPSVVSATEKYLVIVHNAATALYAKHGLLRDSPLSFSIQVNATLVSNARDSFRRKIRTPHKMENCNSETRAHCWPTAHHRSRSIRKATCCGPLGKPAG